jgi:hypothetical protein
MTIIVRNVKKEGKLYPLAWDLAKKLSEFLELRDEKIWCQTEKKITAVCGYPHTWFSIPMHHYCLILRKP